MSEFAFPAMVSRGDGLASVVAYNVEATRPLHSADENHPHWSAIIEGLKAGDPNVWGLFDVAGGVMQRFQQITDRVSWNGSEVLFDGDPIHSVLAEQLSRAIQEGTAENYTALAKFWEKLESNPEKHSREQAYDFLAAHSFQITPEGDVIGFKGVQYTNGYDSSGGLRSGRKSEKAGVPSAFVDGKAVPELSYVPNNVGTVVSMPRSEVKHDPTQTCERGLHVSTHSYAQSWGHGGTVVEVHMNPRDIVSVPNGAGGEKVRTNRYYVASIAGEPDEYGHTVVKDSVASSWAGDVGYKV